jgi:lipopolysaccharide/colanic/teichoic acid biosynthesis glycosyltransferase
MPRSPHSASVIRLLDVSLSLTGLIILSPVFVVVWLLVRMESPVPLFRQQRIGRFQRPFVLIKFRTMRQDTAALATHLVDATAITRVGRFLRASKLDELPQLWNVLCGDMSLVGPRPCLPSQTALITHRASRGVYASRPGITGLAQVRGIDMSTPEHLAEQDAEMLATLDVKAYFRYVILTLSGRGSGDRVRRAI